MSFPTYRCFAIMLHASFCFSTAAFISNAKMNMWARTKMGMFTTPSSSPVTTLASTVPNQQQQEKLLQNDHENDPSESILKAIGVPETIQHLEVGQCVRAFRRSYDDSTQTTTRNFSIERLSAKPNIFLLQNFLSPYECDSIIQHALDDRTEMTNAETITDNDSTSRKRCQVAWISSSSSSSPPLLSSMVSNLVSSTANILLSKDVLQHESASVEDLQVLKYDIGGEFVLHHDGEPRILTVIYYVNGVGGTWFPLAQKNENEGHDDTYSRNINEEEFEEEFLQCRKAKSSTETTPENKAQALQLGKGFIPGKHGLLVKGIDKEVDCMTSEDGGGTNTISNSGSEMHAESKNIAWIRKGDAIAFYNYQSDGSGKLDWRSLHTGLPTEEKDGTKWIANHWFRLGHLSNI